LDASGTASSISIIKGLRLQNKYKVKIIATDMNDFNAGRYIADEFYQIHSKTNEEFLKEIIDICKKEEAEIFIPIIDERLIFLSKNKEFFEKNGIFMLLSNQEAIEISCDKEKTYLFFKENNIPTPKLYFDISEIEYPTILKPRIGGRASLNVYKISDKESLNFYLSRFNQNQMILQQYIEGIEFTADCLNSLDGNIFIAGVVRKRIETKSGVSVKAEIIEGKIEEKILEYIEYFSTKLKIIGAYNVQGFITEKEEIYFTEINPRFAGTHAFTISAGLNSIQYIIDMYKGKSPNEIKSEIKINKNLKMIRYWDEIFIDKDKIFNPWRLWKI